MSLVRPMAERNLRQLNCNKLFMGVNGIKPNQGVFTHQMEEAYLNQIKIDIADEVILVSDSSKFEKSGLAFICGLEKVNMIITDNGIASHHLDALEKYTIEVIIA